MPAVHSSCSKSIILSGNRRVAKLLMTLPFGIAQLHYLPKEVHLLNGLILFIFLNRIRF